MIYVPSCEYEFIKFIIMLNSLDVMCTNTPKKVNRFRCCYGDVSIRDFYMTCLS